MEKISYKHEIIHGRILEIEHHSIDSANGTDEFDEITIVDLDQNTFDKITTNEPNLYVGEKIIVMHYAWATIKKLVIIDGIIDKNRYDNAVRDSQKMPNGWICEPKVELVEDFGTVEFDDTDIWETNRWKNIEYYIRPYNDPKNLYPLTNYYQLEPLKKGGDIVAQTLYITHPDGEITTEQQVMSRKTYDEYINNDEDLNKKRFELPKIPTTPTR